MKITKEAIKAVIKEKIESGMAPEEIEEEFKAALKIKVISVEEYCEAMEEIYK